ncbi:MAG: hypothetical protein AAGM22_27730, partial [Acidobacteriota bacterium]
MYRSEPVLQAAIQQRTATLLQKGWRVSSGSSGTKDAEDLADFSRHFLGSVRLFGSVLSESLDAIHYGFSLQNAIFGWRDWRGRPYFAPRRLIDKPREKFRFTRDRHLAYVGDGYVAKKVFATAKERQRWFITSWGTQNNPYGDFHTLQGSYLIWYLKNRFLEMWSTGIKRSMGIITAKQHGSSPAMSLARGPKGADGNEKTMMELVGELKDSIDLLDTEGVLISRHGYLLDLL